MIELWNIGKEVLSVFSEFHFQGEFAVSLNAAFISLIPKKIGALNIKDYQQISFLGSL